MIRITPTTSDTLREHGRQRWNVRAARRTERNRGARQLRIKSNIWSQIKPVLAKRQLEKCGYCERWLGTDGVEFDVDHFRPKSQVDSWPSPTGYPADCGGAASSGYYLLAYNVENYVVACLSCNRTYKKTYFPTAQSRRLDDASAADLSAELPYLINPADPNERDPEELIGWNGVIPSSSHLSGFDRERVRVTIEVFKLTREDLLRDRYEVLCGLWSAHLLLRATNGRDQHAAEQWEVLAHHDSRHAACARAFKRLCETDPEAAQRELNMAKSLVSRPGNLRG